MSEDNLHDTDAGRVISLLRAEFGEDIATLYRDDISPTENKVIAFIRDRCDELFDKIIKNENLDDDQKNMIIHGFIVTILTHALIFMTRKSPHQEAYPQRIFQPFFAGLCDAIIQDNKRERGGDDNEHVRSR